MVQMSYFLIVRMERRHDHDAMTTIVICSLLIGAMLGIRFRVFVLLPVVLFGSTFLAVILMAWGGTLFEATIAMVTFATLLQLGYLGAGLLKLSVRRPMPGNKSNPRELSVFDRSRTGCPTQRSDEGCPEVYQSDRHATLLRTTSARG